MANYAKIVLLVCSGCVNDITIISAMHLIVAQNQDKFGSLSQTEVERTLTPYVRNLPLLHITIRLNYFDMTIVEIHAAVSYKAIFIISLIKPFQSNRGRYIHIYND